ncbi:hypothetical protein BVY04_04730 [bacterium M21]|nr:hypothetical protein BVY04_04730 [bacterium M21]
MGSFFTCIVGFEVCYKTIWAEVLGLTELSGRSVSRAAGIGGGAAPGVDLGDIIDINKRPESYTGGLSPKYGVMENGVKTGNPIKKSSGG